LARFIMAMTSAFFVARSAFGLPAAAFFVRAVFFAGLAVLALRFPLGCAAGSPLLPFSGTNRVCAHRVSPCRVCGRHSHHFHEKAQSSQDAVADFLCFYCNSSGVVSSFLCKRFSNIG
jgi:hypothetical protein